MEPQDKLTILSVQSMLALNADKHAAKWSDKDYPLYTAATEKAAKFLREMISDGSCTEKPEHFFASLGGSISAVSVVARDTIKGAMDRHGEFGSLTMEDHNEAFIQFVNENIHDLEEAMTDALTHEDAERFEETDLFCFKLLLDFFHIFLLREMGDDGHEIFVEYAQKGL